MEQIAIVSPCYNEEKAILDFLQSLDEVLETLPGQFWVLMVNDGSTDGTATALSAFTFKASHVSLVILQLPVNVGHQAAIYQGMRYASNLRVQQIIVMDSDGEDDPRVIPELLGHSDIDIVHVRRGKRARTGGFHLAYASYRLLFWMITGKRMNFGHFSMISRPVMERLLYNSFIHYPAALLKQNVSRAFVKADRPKRLAGEAKMKTSDLLQHALKSLVEFAEPLLRVFLRIFVLIMLFFMGYTGYVLYHKFISGKAISGWASTLSIGLLNMALLSIGFFALGLLLLNLSYRQQQGQRAPLYTITTQEDKEHG